ncbi:MAG: 2OG-Fe(II) oxygenase [Moorea sp. SIO3A2]|nr:2OG-Fe(II) oxygenase [Moorena sp. SIO3A2]
MIMKNTDIKIKNISDLKRLGYLIIDNFLTIRECETLLKTIANYRQKKYEVTEVYRPFKERDLRYFVINGQQIEKYLPEVWQLYENVNLLVNKVSSQVLFPLSNKLPAVNINIIKPGGEYRWHYDRNAVTALLYLNSVEGGELEMYPNYRLRFGRKNQQFTFIQKCLDAVVKLKLIRYFFGKKVFIKPRQGMIVIMQGDKCLHSVKALEGEQERINVVMSYDFPGVEFIVEKGLDSYLYTNQKGISSDPNYV